MDRRSFLRGAACLLAAPAIVRASSLMPVKAWSDGVALFSAPHPGSMAVDFNVDNLRYSNLIDFAEISEESLEWMIIELKKQTDHFGNRVRLFPRPLILNSAR